MAYTRITLRRGGVRVVLDKGAPGGVGWVEVDRYEGSPVAGRAGGEPGS